MHTTGRKGVLPIFEPYQLITLAEMISKFRLPYFIRSSNHLSTIATKNNWSFITPEEFTKDLQSLEENAKAHGLERLAAGASHYLAVEDLSKRDLREMCEDLLRRFNEDTSDLFFIALHPGDAAWYRKRNLFGKKVTKEFPDLDEHISEAGSCYALGRFGASAYHVSVIMERAAQRLATRVKIKPKKGKRIADTNWQDLTNLITAKLQTRKRSTHRQREMNALLSEVNNHLWNVKEAYRNKIAHGKQRSKAKNWEDHESKLMFILLQQTENFLQFYAENFPGRNTGTKVAVKKVSGLKTKTGMQVLSTPNTP